MYPKHVAQVIPAYRLETIREFLYETGMTTSLDKNSILQKKLSESKKGSKRPRKISIHSQKAKRDVDIKNWLKKVS